MTATLARSYRDFALDYADHQAHGQETSAQHAQHQHLHQQSVQQGHPSSAYVDSTSQHVLQHGLSNQHPYLQPPPPHHQNLQHPGQQNVQHGGVPSSQGPSPQQQQQQQHHQHQLTSVTSLESHHQQLHQPAHLLSHHALAPAPPHLQQPSPQSQYVGGPGPQTLLSYHPHSAPPSNRKRRADELQLDLQGLSGVGVVGVNVSEEEAAAISAAAAGGVPGPGAGRIGGGPPNLSYDRNSLSHHQTPTSLYYPPNHLPAITQSSQGAQASAYHHHHLPESQQRPAKMQRQSYGDGREQSPPQQTGPPSVVGQEGMPPPAPRPRGPKLKFTPEDDQLLVDLKEKKNLTWKQIADFFPGRSSGTLQVRYCTKLKAKTTVWTDDMVDKLRVAMQEYEADRWRIIAAKVGSGFTPAACREKATEMDGGYASQDVPGSSSQHEGDVEEQEEGLENTTTYE